MINNNLVNSWLLNWISNSNIQSFIDLSKKVIFNNYILNDCENKNILIEDTNIEDWMEIETEQLEYSNGFWEITDVKFKKKIFNINIAIFTNSKEELRLKIREIKRNLLWKTSKFYYNQTDRKQYLIATCTNIDIPDNYQTETTLTQDLNWAVIVSFITYTPFINNTSDSIDTFSITNKNYRQIFNNNWDFETEIKYVIQCKTCNATWIELNLNWNMISYQGQINDGDIIIIDWKKWLFKINNISKNFNWVIENLQIDWNDLTINFITNNSLEYDLNLSFNQKFH